MAVPPDAPPSVVRQANDTLRTTFTGGKVVYSEWVQEMDDDMRAEITKAVMEYSYFRDNTALSWSGIGRSSGKSTPGLRMVRRSGNWLIRLPAIEC